MSPDEKFNLITRNLEEVLTPEELRELIASGTPLKHYIGYEVSGVLHIGQGLYTMMKIKDLQDAGVETTVLLADWHAWLNNKLYPTKIKVPNATMKSLNLERLPICPNWSYIIRPRLVPTATGPRGSRRRPARPR